MELTAEEEIAKMLTYESELQIIEGSELGKHHLSKISEECYSAMELIMPVDADFEKVHETFKAIRAAVISEAP